LDDRQEHREGGGERLLSSRVAGVDAGARFDGRERLRGGLLALGSAA
jgi:hypothetical protein